MLSKKIETEKRMRGKEGIERNYYSRMYTEDFIFLARYFGELLWHSNYHITKYKHITSLKGMIMTDLQLKAPKAFGLDELVLCVCTCQSCLARILLCLANSWIDISLIYIVWH